LSAVAGCGRVFFDPPRQLAPDGLESSVDAAPTTCDPAMPFTSIRPVEGLNSPSLEGAARFSPDELTTYFHTLRFSGGLELGVASRSRRDLPFDSPMALGRTTGWPAISPDGLALVYSTNDGSGNQDELFVATRSAPSGPFGGGTKLVTTSTILPEASPLISADSTALWFTRFEAGQPKIYSATWPDAAVMRRYDELDDGFGASTATLSPDQLTMYFTIPDVSNGTNDVFVARRSQRGDLFGSHVPVAIINTTANEAATWLSPDLCRLYFESDQTGDYDMYVAERAP
jgi:hypothetical protein